MNKFICSLTFLLVFYTSFSQEEQGASAEFNYDQEIAKATRLPNSPEAAAFAKYGNVPVSMYTGTPSIEVPLYTLQTKEMAVPIRLTYDASGLKVEQLATWVGLGWNLQAGGVVTRNLMGRPDARYSATAAYKAHYNSETRAAMASYGTRVDGGPYPPGFIRDYFVFLDKYQDDEYDTQPDYYSFSAPGASGTFFIDYTTDLGVSMENPNIQIIPQFNTTHASYSNSNNRLLKGFTVITETGTRYEFTNRETTHHFTTKHINGVEGNFKEVYASSWFLSKIVTAVTQEEIEFVYSTAKIWDNPQNGGRTTFRSDFLNSTSSQVSCSGQLAISNDSSYQIEQFDLKEIRVNGKKRLLFTTNPTDRLDLAGKKSLKEINIYDDNLKLNKKITLNTTYFNDDLSNPTEFDLRLRLDGLTIEGYASTNDVITPTSNANAIQTYDFDYNAGSLPSRLSLAQDYWGYYNGESNSTLIPKYNDGSTLFSGANREPVLSYTQKGVLQKITYPTRGSTSFEYELHKLKPITQENTYDQSIASLTGGIDPNDTYNYLDCDDAGAAPKAVSRFFTVDEDGTYKITLRSTQTGNATTSGNFTHLAIYQSYDGDGTCRDVEFPPGSGIINRVCDNDTPPRQYCEVMNNTTIPLWEEAFGVNYTKTFTATLQTGKDYRVFLASIIEGNSVSVTIEKSKTITVTPQIGGLRVKTVRDYDNDGTQTTSKRYIYDHYKREQPESTALVHQSASFHDFRQQETVAGSGLGATTETCTMLNRYSSNLNAPVNNVVTYSTVSEVLEDDSFTVFNFHNRIEASYRRPYPVKHFLNGQVKSQSVYKADKSLLQHTIHHYDDVYLGNKRVGFTLDNYESKRQFAKISQSPQDPNMEQLEYLAMSPLGESCFGAQGIYCKPGPVSKFQPLKYSFTNHWIKNDSTITKQFYGTDSLVTKTAYHYDNLGHRLLTRILITDSKGNHVETQTFYPEDVTVTTSLGQALENETYTAIQELKRNGSNPRIAEPIQTVTTNNGSQTTLRRNFKIWNNGFIQPKTIQTAKEDDELESRLIYENYDTKGNLLEAFAQDGVHSMYIWGYDGQYPIAKIENSSYTDIPVEVQTLIDEAITASDNDTDLAKETQLLGKLKQLREHVYFENTMITTYTYDPQVGVTSMTDPRGYTMYYTYDDLGRLHHVKDAQGHLVSENKYHYKN
ncbi:RHS repeat domain-containing protein [Aquimarina gracilis]|uniref:RHS repeat domain-containing protein n=1 Tax=Aquimarina gracilis TaxID=874422 RepID=A0ABU5ZV72_9FLAO|nr:RHS repeat domain-containing protein [Aquimarina gracilis]MEB3345497.1 RHS repeat domain-containing protein [Aquimarina gracilis]